MERVFSVDFEEARLIGDVVPSGGHPHWLFLHGAGQADRKRFEKLRKLLLTKDISSCAFDFIGHGETGGDLNSSSLASRTKQALAVIQSQRIQQPLSVLAASMSGYTAIKLIESHDIQNLVFLAPGVYTAKAYSLPFGPQFTEAIREPNSWQQSDAWEILKKYKGNLLIFAAENDQVVPKELIERLYQSAEQANFREIITIKDSTHPLGKWLNEHPNDLQLVFEKITKTISGPRA